MRERVAGSGVWRLGHWLEAVPAATRCERFDRYFELVYIEVKLLMVVDKRMPKAVFCSSILFIRGAPSQISDYT